MMYVGITHPVQDLSDTYLNHLKAADVADSLTEESHICDMRLSWGYICRYVCRYMLPRYMFESHMRQLVMSHHPHHHHNPALNLPNKNLTPISLNFPNSHSTFHTLPKNLSEESRSERTRHAPHVCVSCHRCNNPTLPFLSRVWL